MTASSPVRRSPPPRVFAPLPPPPPHSERVSRMFPARITYAPRSANFRFQSQGCFCLNCFRFRHRGFVSTRGHTCMFAGSTLFHPHPGPIQTALPTPLSRRPELPRGDGGRRELRVLQPLHHGRPGPAAPHPSHVIASHCHFVTLFPRPYRGITIGRRHAAVGDSVWAVFVEFEVLCIRFDPIISVSFDDLRWPSI